MNSLGIPPRDLIAPRFTWLAAATLLTVPGWAEVDCKHWNTPFFFQYADVQDVSRCLDAGNSPRERDSSGTTPLHLAAVHGGPAQIRVLVDHGADLDAPDTKGHTALHLAAETWKDSQENIMALVDAGAGVEARDESGETPLHLAASRGTLAKINALLDAEADVNARDTDGETPLHKANRRHAPANILALLKAGADVSARDELGNTPLHAAARAENASGIKALLEAGAAVNARDEYGETPLHEAAALATPAEIAILLDAGADTGAKDDYGETPLHSAAGLPGSAENIRALAEAGADPNAQDNTGETPLHEAAISSRSPETIAALIEVGAQLESRDQLGWTPLRRAAEFDSVENQKALLDVGADPGALDDGKSLLETIREEFRSQQLSEPAAVVADCTHWTSPVFFLLASPEDVARCIEDGASLAGDSIAGTPLHAAAAAGRPEHVAAVLTAGGEVGSQTEFGMTPLHAAVTNASQPMPIRTLVEDVPNISRPDTATRLASIAVLLDAGADIHVRDQFGATLLHAAAVHGQPEYIAALIDAGLDVNARDESGRTPLHVAVSVNNSMGADLASILDLDPTEDVTATRLAFLAANVVALIKAGADIDARDEDGETPLHSAAESGNPEHIAVLVDAGADINAPDESGQTPLHAAAAVTPSRGSSFASFLGLSPDADVEARNRATLANYIAALIATGADVHRRDNEGRTPLHTAAKEGIAESMETLLEGGADINIGDDAGDTPLHLAITATTSENLVALLTAGANVDARNGDGRTPLHETWRSSTDHLSILLSAGG